MNQKLATLTLKYDSTVLSIVQELIEHPDLSSKEVAEKLGIPREKLLEYYHIIQDNTELQRLVVGESRYPRLTMTASDLVTFYSGYLTKALTGEWVYPLILEFHSGPVCQCHCKFCFSLEHDYDEQNNGSKPINLERVIKVFEECKANGVEEIWFSGGKEPFSNPLTPEYVRLATKIGLRARLYTNGIAMTPAIQEAILDSYQIRISVNGAKPETYYRVQFPRSSLVEVDGLFEQITKNISSLVSLKKAQHKPIRIGMSQILQPDNHNEVVEFAKLASRLGVDSVHFRLETMGMVRDFNQQEKETIQREIAELTSKDYGVEVDIRGVAEGEFETRTSQFLPGLKRPVVCRAGILKRGLNPYGALYNCQFSSHPRFQARVHLRLGDVTNESLGDILRRHISKYPPPCAVCQAHEYGLAITLERLENDLKYGIPIEKQPYYRIRSSDDENSITF